MCIHRYTECIHRVRTIRAHLSHALLFPSIHPVKCSTYTHSNVFTAKISCFNHMQNGVRFGIMWSTMYVTSLLRKTHLNYKFKIHVVHCARSIANIEPWPEYWQIEIVMCAPYIRPLRKVQTYTINLAYSINRIRLFRDICNLTSTTNKLLIQR